MASKRFSVFHTPPLDRILENHSSDSPTARISSVCERYELICASEMNEAGKLDTFERSVIANALSGSVVDPALIRHLDHEIEDMRYDIDDETDPRIRRLAERIRLMSMAQRVALIESLGF